MSDKRAALQARIAAARTESQAIDAAEAERRELEALEAEAEAAERAVRDARAIVEAEKKLGRRGKAFEVVTTDLGAVILRRPDPIRYKRFVDEAKTSQDEIEAFVRTCREYPPEAEFSKLLEELPGSLGAMSNAVGQLAGIHLAEVQGKA